MRGRLTFFSSRSRRTTPVSCLGSRLSVTFAAESTPPSLAGASERRSQTTEGALVCQCRPSSVEETSLDLTLRCVRDLGSVDPAAWDALDHGGSPFVEHGFLRALELSRSISGSSGWDPYY